MFDPDTLTNLREGLEYARERAARDQRDADHYQATARQYSNWAALWRARVADYEQLIRYAETHGDPLEAAS
ncbi:MAG: hypothetical protein ACRDMV_25175 [Streptosporangiales bacterium]